MNPLFYFPLAVRVGKRGRSFVAIHYSWGIGGLGNHKHTRGGLSARILLTASQTNTTQRARQNRDEDGVDVHVRNIEQKLGGGSMDWNDVSDGVTHVAKSNRIIPTTWRVFRKSYWAQEQNHLQYCITYIRVNSSRKFCHDSLKLLVFVVYWFSMMPVELVWSCRNLNTEKIYQKEAHYQSLALFRKKWSCTDSFIIRQVKQTLPHMLHLAKSPVQKILAFSVEHYPYQYLVHIKKQKSGNQSSNFLSRK